MVYMFMYIIDMARQYSVAEARSNLPAIIDEAAGGTAIELTRRGKPVAVVVSIRDFDRLRGSRPRFSDVYEAFVKAHPPADLGVDADFARSVRHRASGRKVSL
jgi:prevent-host-death family protein